MVEAPHPASDSVLIHSVLAACSAPSMPQCRVLLSPSPPVPPDGVSPCPALRASARARSRRNSRSSSRVKRLRSIGGARCSICNSRLWKYGAAALAASMRIGSSCVSSRMTASRKSLGRTPVFCAASIASFVILLLEPRFLPLAALLPGSRGFPFLRSSAIF
jgi:hypothetical protein